MSSDPREKKAVLGSRMGKAIYESSKNNSLMIWYSVCAYQTKILGSQTIGKKKVLFLKYQFDQHDVKTKKLLCLGLTIFL